MNKPELEEVIKIMREPISVNCIDYKYFTQEQYDRLISVYENALWLVDYSIAQGRMLDDLWGRIEKALDFIINYNDKTLDDDEEIPEELYEILRGE